MAEIYKDRSSRDMSNPFMGDAKRAIPGLKIDEFRSLKWWVSGHGVMFGTTRTHGDVVVKPHTKVQRALHEARSIGRVSKLGFGTPRFLGLMTGKKAMYLVTEEEKGLHTLGELDWERSIADPNLRRVLLPKVETAAQDLADLHVAGVAHGDYRPKNVVDRFAENESRGHQQDVPDRPFFLDLERANLNASGDPGLSDRARDLYQFGGSLLMYGFLSDRSPSFREGFLSAQFLGPHMDAVGGAANALVDYDLISSHLRTTAITGKPVKI